MLTLYHNDMSLCAQKVRICLAEKGLAWEDKHLVLRAAEHQAAVVSQAQPPRRGTDAPSRWTRRHGVKCHSRIPGGRLSTAAAAA